MERRDDPSKAGWAFGSRSTSLYRIVPVKQGQPPERPCGGTEVSGHGTVGGNDGGDIELQNYLNET